MLAQIARSGTAHSRAPRQGPRRESRILELAYHYREVDSGVDQVQIALTQRDVEIDIRVFFMELVQPGQKVNAREKCGAQNAYFSPRGLLRLPQRILDSVDLIENPAAACVIFAAELGDGGAARSPYQELGTELGLEPADVFGHCRDG